MSLGIRIYLSSETPLGTTTGTLNSLAIATSRRKDDSHRTLGVTLSQNQKRLNINLQSSGAVAG